MLKKKRPTNKENHKKRTPLNTIHCINYTEDLRMPTLGTIDLKNLTKSIELRKVNPNNQKKPVSRKSRSKSVKQGSSTQPIRYKNIINQFKQLKMMQDNQKSKSKSPASCKSKSTKKHNFKLFTTMRTNPNNSETNLTLKLEKTLKKLNEADYFHEEEDLIPIGSSSDAFENGRLPQILVTESEEDINMNELRQFCSTVSLAEKKNFNFYKHDKKKSTLYEAMAIKIQRAWRRYQTTKLVQRYVYLSRQHFTFSNHPSQLFSEGIAAPQHQETVEAHYQTEIQQRSDEIIIPSDEFYPQNMQRDKVTQISNLEQELKSCSAVVEQQNYQEAVKRIKMQQLQKWNEIISIISVNRSDNPMELQRLLMKLAERSQINKKDLEDKANQILTYTSRKKYQQEQIIENKPVEKKSESQEFSNGDSVKSSRSKGLEEYDSKKYIEYLDVDIFPLERQNSSKSSNNSSVRINREKISKKKQEQLLQELKTVNFPIKLGEASLYRAQSLKQLRVKQKPQKQKMFLKKSTSEKTMKRVIESMSPNIFQNFTDEEINLQLLTREFLEGTDPTNQNFDMVYSEEKLKEKLAELNTLNQNDSYQDYENIFEQQNNEGVSFNAPLSKQEDQNKIPVPHIQHLDKSLDSDSQDELKDEKQIQQYENVSSMIFNSLLLQVLKQIAIYQNSILQKFKAFSISIKPKVKRVENNSKRKKGFPTNKAQIQHFLQNIIKYLKKEEPQVFKNLEVSTGPTAIQMLKYMHHGGDDQSFNLEEDDDQSNVMVVPNRVFDQFWSLKQKSIVVETSETVDHSNTAFRQNFQYLKGFNKIFYRSLFDTFNECLDFERNYGQFGKPFPWKKNPLFFHVKSDQIIQSNISSAQKRMLDVCSTYCGLIIEKEEMAGLQGNEQYIQQVQQDRLSRMLAADLIDGQQRWMFYDDEETQILIEISNAIYTQMMIDMVEELTDFM